MQAFHLLLDLSLLALLGEKNGVDVGKNTALGDGDRSQKLVELLVVSDGQLDVAGNNAGLLVVASGVSGELEDLGGEVLEDGGKVHGGTSSNTSSESSSLEEAADTTDGELKSSLGRLGSGLLSSGLTTTGLSSLGSSFSRHIDC